MAVDSKNIVRIDMEDIFNAARRKSFYVVRALNSKSDGRYHEDDYAISGNEIEELYDSIMEGASKISNYASMVKHHTQTGLDGLTHYQDLETPTDADSYVDPDSETANDEYITGPDNTTVYTRDIIGKEHDTGEKLTKGIGDTVVFSVTDLEDDHNRYTMVQQFIREALVAFALYKWFSLMNVPSQASVHFAEFEKTSGDIRFNAVINHQRKNCVRRTGQVF